MGNNLTYRITVTNQGSDPATDVHVVDTPSGSVELVSIGDPDMDLALMAVAQGAKGIGPVTQPEQFAVAKPRTVVP